MKDLYKIFVEGAADKRFIEQLISYLFNEPAKKDYVIATNGYGKLLTKTTQETYLNQMKRNSDDGGVNLVIFDADDDFEQRKYEIEVWREENNVDFQLFLFPDNSHAGELENLLESIINPENQPVMDSWTTFEDSLKEIRLPWKEGPLTIPAKKTKIYAYLEVLLGPSKSEKEKIKEKNREYTNTHHWNLNAYALESLTGFLKRNLSNDNKSEL